MSASSATSGGAGSLGAIKAFRNRLGGIKSPKDEGPDSSSSHHDPEPQRRFPISPRPPVRLPDPQSQTPQLTEEEKKLKAKKDGQRKALIGNAENYKHVLEEIERKKKENESWSPATLFSKHDLRTDEFLRDKLSKDPKVVALAKIMIEEDRKKKEVEKILADQRNVIVRKEDNSLYFNPLMFEEKEENRTVNVGNVFIPTTLKVDHWKVNLDKALKEGFITADEHKKYWDEFTQKDVERDKHLVDRLLGVGGNEKEKKRGINNYLAEAIREKFGPNVKIDPNNPEQRDFALKWAKDGNRTAAQIAYNSMANVTDGTLRLFANGLRGTADITSTASVASYDLIYGTNYLATFDPQSMQYVRELHGMADDTISINFEIDETQEGTGIARTSKIVGTILPSIGGGPVTMVFSAVSGIGEQNQANREAGMDPSEAFMKSALSMGVTTLVDQATGRVFRYLPGKGFVQEMAMDAIKGETDHVLGTAAENLINGDDITKGMTPLDVERLASSGLSTAGGKLHSKLSPTPHKEAETKPHDTPPKHPDHTQNKPGEQPTLHNNPDEIILPPRHLDKQGISHEDQPQQVDHTQNKPAEQTLSAPHHDDAILDTPDLERQRIPIHNSPEQVDHPKNKPNHPQNKPEEQAHSQKAFQEKKDDEAKKAVQPVQEKHKEFDETASKGKKALDDAGTVAGIGDEVDPGAAKQHVNKDGEDEANLQKKKPSEEEEADSAKGKKKDASDDDKKDLREEYLGSTPDKYSGVGQQVIARMKSEGKIKQVKVKFLDKEEMLVWSVHIPDGKGGGRWEVLGDKFHMGHVRDAVDWWNVDGKEFGPKSEIARQFMKNADNYIMEWGADNSLKGANEKQTYDAPGPVNKDGTYPTPTKEVPDTVQKFFAKEEDLAAQKPTTMQTQALARKVREVGTDAALTETQKHKATYDAKAKAIEDTKNAREVFKKAEADSKVANKLAKDLETEAKAKEEAAKDITRGPNKRTATQEAKDAAYKARKAADVAKIAANKAKESKDNAEKAKRQATDDETKARAAADDADAKVKAARIKAEDEAVQVIDHSPQ